MKKIISFIIALILIAQSNMLCCAQNSPTVSAEAVSLNFNEMQLIPVYIENNTGIMGFKISIEYPESYIEIKSVTKGAVTSNGNFNSNIGSKSGVIDIIWNNTENVSEDGSIFILGLQLKKNTTKEIEIGLSFSQDDTFNEDWEDVNLVCKDIIINSSTSASDNQEHSQPTEYIDLAEVDNSQIITAVETALEQTGYLKIGDVEDKESFVEAFNDNLKIITDSDKYSIQDFDAIKESYSSAYKSTFVLSVFDNIESDEIETIISASLNDFDVKSIDEIDESNKEAFVQEILEKIQEYGIDISDASEKSDTEDLLSAIDELYNTASDDSENEGQDNYFELLIICVAAIVIIAVLVIVLIIYLRKRNKE